MSKAFKFEVTKDGKLIIKMNGNLSERNKSMMADAHITAVSCVLHAVYAVDGTTTPGAQLCEVFKQDERVNALKRWFETVGPFKYKAGKDNKDFTFVLDKARIDSFRARDEAELTRELLEGKTFWELVPPKARATPGMQPAWCNVLPARIPRVDGLPLPSRPAVWER